MVKIMLVLIVILASSAVDAARILAMYPIGAKSHHRFLQPLAATLARAGHQVVMYSPIPFLLDDKPDNLTIVTLENVTVMDVSAEAVPLIQRWTENPFWKCQDLHWDYEELFYHEVIGDTKFKELLSSDQHFDLIIAESFSCQEAISVILSRKFMAPLIGLQAAPTNNLLNNIMGNSLSLSYIPDTCTKFSNKMSFLERFLNVFSSLRGLYYHYNYYIPKVEKKMWKDLPDMPPIGDLSKVVSLVFVNDHLTVDYVHPRTPNIIPLAGLHIQPPTPLPEDIKKFMDDATHGVIYFSLGTYVVDEFQPKEYFDMYNNVFSKLKQRVLWKTRKDNVEGLPPNVMTLKWAPQKDILAHPACVLFVTHGGQLSKVEALHFGVPVVSIAQFYDQHKNSEFYEHNGIGVKLDRSNLTEETISGAINRILKDKSYRENMKKLSAIFKDRPLSPAESVVFWTEYVLRHGGAAHLRPASTELRWYQLILLDITILCLAIVFTIVLFLIIVMKIICKYVLKRNNVPYSKKNS